MLLIWSESNPVTYVFVETWKRSPTAIRERVHCAVATTWLTRSHLETAICKSAIGDDSWNRSRGCSWQRCGCVGDRSLQLAVAIGGRRSAISVVELSACGRGRLSSQARSGSITGWNGEAVSVNLSDSRSVPILMFVCLLCVAVVRRARVWSSGSTWSRCCPQRRRALVDAHGWTRTRHGRRRTSVPTPFTRSTPSTPLIVRVWCKHIAIRFHVRTRNLMDRNPSHLTAVK